MTQTVEPAATASAERAYKAAKRYIYAWGDGTAEGTVLVEDINPGSSYGSPASSYPDDLTAVGGTLFFSADDGEHGRELWKSDGTAEGTVLVEDIWAGPNVSFPDRLTAVGETLFFTANDGEHGRELWKSDGTEAGTVLVKDINIGSDSSDISNLVSINAMTFFAAKDAIHGTELW